MHNGLRFPRAAQYLQGGKMFSIILSREPRALSRQKWRSEPELGEGLEVNGRVECYHQTGSTQVRGQ